jgi:hypothetical protein
MENGTLAWCFPQPCEYCHSEELESEMIVSGLQQIASSVFAWCHMSL